MRGENLNGWTKGGNNLGLAMTSLHNCLMPPSLLVEGLLSTGAIPSSVYLLVKMGLLLHLFPVYIC